jgi:hypothetical protein
MGKWVHRLLEVDADSKTGLCEGCGPVDVRMKKRWRCINAVNQYRGNPANRDPEKKREGYKSASGTHYLSRADRRELFTQSSQECQICHLPLTFEESRYDHCHESGKHRGFLCNSCNSGLGMFKDDTDILESAIRYLSDDQSRVPEN